MKQITIAGVPKNDDEMLGGSEYVMAKNLPPARGSPGLFYDDDGGPDGPRIRNVRDGIERWHEVWIRRSVAPQGGPGFYIVKCAPQRDIDTWEFHDWERIEP
jgi:hypothetical protein